MTLRRGSHATGYHLRSTADQMTERVAWKIKCDADRHSARDGANNVILR